MGQTRKRHYDRYTLAYKLTAVKLANHPEVKSRTIAECLGLHPVMLYRWQMEYRRGELRESRYAMKKEDSPRRRRADPGHDQAEALMAAKRRIKQLEKILATREEELELLKKAKRFFENAKR